MSNSDDYRALLEVCDNLRVEPEVVIRAKQHTDDRSVSFRRKICQELKAEKKLTIPRIARLAQLSERAIQKMMRGAVHRAPTSAPTS